MSKKLFLQNHVKKQIKELFISVWVENFAMTLLTLFVPVYLWTLNYPIWMIGYYFLITYVAYFLVLPFGAKLAAKIGYTHTIAFSMPINVLFYISLYGVTFWPSMFYVSAVLYALSKAFYYVPYYADFSTFGGQRQRGREIAIMYVVGQLTIFGAPLIAGTILSELSFAWLFGIGSVLLLISVIPLFGSPDTPTHEKVPYLEIYRKFFAKENRRRFVTFLGFGEELIAMTVWPIYVFIIVGNFLTFGAVLTASTVVSSVFLLLTGKLTDKISRARVVKGTSLIYFLSWFPKLFITTPLGVFLTDSVGQFSKTALMIPMSAVMYSEAKHSYKEKVLLGSMMFEMGYIPSKIIASLIIMGVGYYMNDLRFLLIVGAFFTLFYFFMHEKSKKASEA